MLKVVHALFRSIAGLKQILLEVVDAHSRRCNCLEIQVES